MNHLLTVREVADMLKIQESTVYAWASQGKIPSVMLSRKALRFREKDLQELIESKLVHPEAQPFNKPRKHKKSASGDSFGLDSQIDRCITSVKKEVLGYS